MAAIPPSSALPFWGQLELRCFPLRTLLLCDRDPGKSYTAVPISAHKACLGVRVCAQFEISPPHQEFYMPPLCFSRVGGVGCIKFSPAREIVGGMWHDRARLTIVIALAPLGL